MSSVEWLPRPPLGSSPLALVCSVVFGMVRVRRPTRPPVPATGERSPILQREIGGAESIDVCRLGWHVGGRWPGASATRLSEPDLVFWHRKPAADVHSAGDWRQARLLNGFTEVKGGTGICRRPRPSCRGRNGVDTASARRSGGRLSGSPPRSPPRPAPSPAP